MMKTILFLVSCLFLTPAFSQYIQLGESDTLCPSQQLEIIGIPFDSSMIILMDNPISAPILGDDTFSPLINIGFDFTFYDSVYHQLTIGSNGIISFNVATANNWCPWYINSPMPNQNLHKNTIMAPWMDLMDIGLFDNRVKYQLIGSAPNRKFVIYRKAPTLYGFPCGWVCWSSTVILNESSNNIDMYLNNRYICPDNDTIIDQDAYAIQGIQNINGTISHIAPGRNYPNLWTTGTDGKRWTPNGVNSYIIEDIPFKVVVDSTFNYQWGNTLGQSFPYSDTLTIIGEANTNIGYYLGISNDNYCDLVIPITDTAWINQDFQTPDLSVLNDYCNAGVGSISVNDSLNADYYWVDQNIFSDTLESLTQGEYSYIYTGNNGCQFQDTILISNDLTLSFQTNPAICTNDSTGSITILPNYPFLSYNWIGYPNDSTNQLEHLTVGTYSCSVVSSVGCSDTLSMSIVATDSLLLINSNVQHESCFEFSDGSFGFEVTGITDSLSISWNGLTTTDQFFDNLSPGNYVLVFSDSIGCLHTDSIIINPALPIIINVITTPELFGNDGSAQITATGGNFPYNYYVNPISQSSGLFEQLSSGQYTCVLTDLNNCQDSIVFIIESVLASDELNLGDFSMSPNPATDILLLKSNEQEYTILINDLLGNLCLQTTVSGNATIDLKLFQSGIYLVSIIDSKEHLVRSEKLVKL